MKVFHIFQENVWTFFCFFCWNMLKMAHFAARHKAQTFGWWMSRISLPCESHQNPTPAPKGTHLTTLWKVTFLLTPYPWAVIHDSCRKLWLKHLGLRVTHGWLHMVIVGQLMLFQYLLINGFFVGSGWRKEPIDTWYCYQLNDYMVPNPLFTKTVKSPSDFTGVLQPPFNGGNRISAL